MDTAYRPAIPTPSSSPTSPYRPSLVPPSTMATTVPRPLPPRPNEATAPAIWPLPHRPAHVWRLVQQLSTRISPDSSLAALLMAWRPTPRPVRPLVQTLLVPRTSTFPSTGRSDLCGKQHTAFALDRPRQLGNPLVPKTLALVCTS